VVSVDINTAMAARQEKIRYHNGIFLLPQNSNITNPTDKTMDRGEQVICCIGLIQQPHSLRKKSHHLRFPDLVLVVGYTT